MAGDIPETSEQLRTASARHPRVIGNTAMDHSTSTTHRVLTAAGKILLGGLAMAVMAGGAQAQSGAASVKSASDVKAVLELFTSQGCSSCPPADDLLAKYAERNDVIALSFSVDYWDYLGWKDTLANPKFSARQKYYAKARGDGRIYTPQIVVNGLAHAVGSSADSIESAITQTAERFQASRVPVSLTMDKARLAVAVGDRTSTAEHGEATVWLVLVDRVVSVKIERGENHGRTVNYTNVVREMTPIGMWTGKSATFAVSREAVTTSPNTICVALVQAGKAGPIIGAAIAREGL